MVFDVMLLPEPEECTELYFHSAESGAVQCSGGVLLLRSGARISFNAYYNLFPAKVYRDYTVCTAPTLHITLQGSGRLSLIACDGEGNILTEETADFAYASPQLHMLSLSQPEQTAAVYWRLVAEADCMVQSAYLSFAEKPEREITLAVGICTYRREEFVKRNAAKIMSIFEKTERKSHHLFISDNGRTLAGVLSDSLHLTVVQNPNTGGSGGFARVMQEAMKSQTKFTHLLLMDDDVDFGPEILDRLLFFLSHLREENVHVTVGGAMCLLDMPWMQFEAGAKFLTGGQLQGLMQHCDLRDAENCIRNITAPQEADYNSWWCCCMSMDRIREAGLPMPFFFKMDDVEYALRMGVPVVCLPGVCVAHEDFVKKYNPALEYYITRNTLITAALHDRLGGKTTMIRNLISAVLRNILLQRYETAKLILRAYEDYLKGADFLKNTDASVLHQEILKCAPHCEPVPDGTQLDAPAAVPKILRLLTLGGILLPCKRDFAVVDAFYASSSESFRVRELLHYYPMTGMGYRTRMKRRRMAGLFAETCRRTVQIFFRYLVVKRSFLKDMAFLKGEPFWDVCNKNP